MTNNDLFDNFWGDFATGVVVTIIATRLVNKTEDGNNKNKNEKSKNGMRIKKPRVRIKKSRIRMSKRRDSGF